MRLDHVIKEASETLTQADIPSARLDTLILLEDILNKDRGHLLAHPDLEVTDAQVSKLNNFITQRQKHVPLAYIRGQAPFYGRDFAVNNHVLVPRPETELIIEMLLRIPFSAPPKIADIGTGSGCIGITAALEIPHSIVDVYDIDKHTLTVAADNARRYGVVIKQYLSNVLDPWNNDYNVVLANLPYVPDEYPINEAAGFEPKLALFSGDDGLDHYRMLWQQISDHNSMPPQHVIIESLPVQHEALIRLAEQATYTLHAVEGYVQHFVRIDSKD